MDKLLTKVRHGLLIVSFLGIFFSLTGASFTGKSAIASYLGLNFSDTNGFKWVYLMILLYTLARYIVHYSDEFIFLMTDSIRRCINKPYLNFFLRKILLDSSGQANNGYYSDFGSWSNPENEFSTLFTLSAYEVDGGGVYSTFDVDLDFKNSSFRKLCYIEFQSDLLVSDVETLMYLNMYPLNNNKGYLKRFTFVGVGVMATGGLMFLFDSFTRFRHFEYSIPLFTALFALFMTINHFFFSEKTLTILTTIRDVII